MGDSEYDLYSRVMNISRTSERSERVSEMFITSEYKSYPLVTHVIICLLYAYDFFFHSPPVTKNHMQ